MADVHRSPGFYRAPDGRGEQWWNGVSWSETRRNAPGGPATPVQPLVPLGATAERRRPNTSATLALVLGIIGLFVSWLAVLAIIFAFLGLRRGPYSAGSRFVAIIGLALGIVGGLALLGDDVLGSFFS